MDHPYLVVHSTTGANGGVGAGSQADAVKALGAGGGDRGVCAICHDPVEVCHALDVHLQSGALGAGGGDRGVCAICHDPVEVCHALDV